MSSAFSVTARRRIAVLLCCFVLMIFILVLRLSYLQVVQNDKFRGLALDQRLYPVPVDAKRGTIYDRNLKELAVSVSADSIIAIPAQIKDPENTAKILAEILELDYSSVYNNITKRQASVYVKRKVDLDKAMAIKKLGLPGIKFTEKGQRFYPKDMLAAHVLGIAGIDNQGLEGLEKEYDHVLKGKPGQTLAERDARGRLIPQGREEYIQPVDGNNLVLTIDEVIQYIAERELDRGMIETNSKRGMVIVMNPKNGEILAMVNRPTYNPNNYQDYPTENRRNIAILDTYEPGSTFKVITSAAALEEGAVTLESDFYDPGYLVVEDRRIHCWKAGGHGHQNFIEATENSCNPAFATLALRLGKDVFYEYVRSFGFGSPTGVDFPGDTSTTGVLLPLKRVGNVELATNGFGQGISVTPLQLLNAVSAIANGGTLYKPRLVKQVIDNRGNVIEEFKPEKIRQVISQKSAQDLNKVMQSVVVNGSGTRAQIKGHPVAGKTGTSQKPEGGRYGDKRIASFVGFAPADDPVLAAIVVLDEPNCGITYGGVLAAPIFKNIIEDSLRYLEIPPRVTDEESSRSQSSSSLLTVGDYRNFILSEAKAKVERAGFKCRVEGSGDLVIDQIPKPGAKVEKGTTVVLYLGSGEESYNISEMKLPVPDVRGVTMKDAGHKLGNSGFRMNPVGSGIAKRQDPAPGVVADFDTVVTVYFE